MRVAEDDYGTNGEIEAMNKEENIIYKFNKTIESLLPKIEKETNEFIEFIEKNKIDYFIKKAINNKKYLSDFDNIIEYRLDYLMTPYTKKFFDKILYYWEELNPKSAKDYKKFYNEFWEE